MYKIGPNSLIVRTSDGAHIPPVEGNTDYQEFLNWLAAGNAAELETIPETPLAPSPEKVAAGFIGAIQLRLDTFARGRHYDSILSACTYATSTVPKFKAEGQACVNLRDSTWAAAYAILEQVQAGQRPVPDDLADIEADLPALEWPQ